MPPLSRTINFFVCLFFFVIFLPLLLGSEAPRPCLVGQRPFSAPPLSHLSSVHVPNPCASVGFRTTASVPLTPIPPFTGPAFSFDPLP